MGRCIERTVQRTGGESTTGFCVDNERTLTELLPSCLLDGEVRVLYLTHHLNYIGHSTMLGAA